MSVSFWAPVFTKGVGAIHRSCRETPRKTLGTFSRRQAGRLAPAGRGSRPERGARRHELPLL